MLRESDTGKESDAKAYTPGQQIRELSHARLRRQRQRACGKWNIKYLGTETIDGIKTDKLELVAKDPAVRKNIPKVTIWLDTARAVSLKQVFDEGEGQSRVCHYTNIKVNQPLPQRFQLRQVESVRLPARSRFRPPQTALESTPACSAFRALQRSAAARCAAACRPAARSRNAAAVHSPAIPSSRYSAFSPARPS